MNCPLQSIAALDIKLPLWPIIKNIFSSNYKLYSCSTCSDFSDERWLLSHNEKVVVPEIVLRRQQNLMSLKFFSWSCEQNKCPLWSNDFSQFTKLLLWKLMNNSCRNSFTDYTTTQQVVFYNLCSWALFSWYFDKNVTVKYFGYWLI